MGQADGSILRIETNGQLAPTIIRPPVPEPPTLSALAWWEEKQVLGVASTVEGNFETENSSLSVKLANLLFMSADGVAVWTASPKSELAAGGFEGGFDSSGQYWSLSEEPRRSADRPNIPEWNLQNWNTGKKISLECFGRPYEDSSSLDIARPALHIGPTGDIVALANLGPSTDADVADTAVRLFDLTKGSCIGLFDHKDELLGVAFNGDSPASHYAFAK